MNIITQGNIYEFIFTTFTLIIFFVVFLLATHFIENPELKFILSLLTIFLFISNIFCIFVFKSSYHSEPVAEKTFTSFTITEGVDNTITVTGVDGDLKKSEFTFDNGLNLKKTKKTIGQLELELLEKDSDGKETVPVLNQQDYDSLKNEIINSPDFGKKYIVTYKKERVVYKTNWEFFLQLLKNKKIPEKDTEEFITITIKPKISVATK